MAPQFTNIAVSESLLEATPARGLDFLKGVAKSPVIYGILVQAGYSAAEHTRGWKLLLEATGAPSSLTAGAIVEPDRG